MIKRYIKAVLTSFTFWFAVLSLITIHNHYTGGDSKSIVLISLHPVLSSLSHNDAARDFLNAGPLVPAKNILGEISVFWYLAHFALSFALGLVLDGIKAVLRRLFRFATAPAAQESQP